MEKMGIMVTGDYVNTEAETSTKIFFLCVWIFFIVVAVVKK